MKHRRMSFKQHFIRNGTTITITRKVQIQESGNQLAIMFTKPKYPDIHTQLESSMRLNGDSKRSSQ
ncbi:MAG: hypothetical protein IKR52_03940 [Paludibacteraceae bacterium]|nr:hypothetical protein [Paludibacteraceae bacterium]